MKNLKKIFFPLLLVLLASPVFADSIGFTSVHKGFWWWLLAVVIAVICVIVIVVICVVIAEEAAHEAYVSASCCLCGCLGFANTISGFFIFPTIWCSALGALLGVLLFMSFLYCLLAKAESAMSWAVCLLVFGLTIAAEVFAAIFLPQSWWLWKYFAVAAIGAGAANIISLDSEWFEFYHFSLITVILLICDFVGFWISFGISGMNVFSAVLLVLFAVILGIILFSPIVMTIIIKRDEVLESAEAPKMIERIAQGLFEYPDFLEKNPDYKSWYDDYKEEIYNRFKEICDENAPRYTEYIAKEMFKDHDFINKNTGYKWWFNNYKDDVMEKLQKIFEENSPKYIEEIANGLLENPDFVRMNSGTNYEAYFKEYNEQILSRLKQLQKAEIEKEQEEKAKEREEQSNKEFFEKAMKSISDDVDVLELSVQNKNFNIQVLSELEKHINVLQKKVNLLNQNDISEIERRRKYLSKIFDECKKGGLCTGTASIRMDEILKMLDKLCEKGETK